MREAQFELGLMYVDGVGVGKDEAKALEWLKKSAERRYPNAQYVLFGAYWKGSLGLKPDKERALVWLQRSANQNFAPAQFQLGLLYANGEGVKKDPRQAYAWMLEAAKNGSHEAKEFVSRIRPHEK